MLRIFRMFFICIIIGSLGTSCHKTTFPSDINSILIGIYYQPTVWHLSTYSVNGSSQPLTTLQKNFSKTYSSNGSFKDSDGYGGTWTASSNNQLQESYANFGAGGTSSQSYTVTIVDGNNITLQYTSNGNQITTTYIAGY